MAKKEEKQSYQDTRAARDSATARQTQYSASKAPERAEARAAYTTGSADLAGRYSDLARTGGIDPTTFNPIRSGFQNFATTGGIDPSVSRNLGEGYRDMSVTGGYTPGDLSNIRRRSGSVLSSTFSRLREGLDRTKRGAGGYAPGFQAATAKLARGESQANAANVRDTELEIADRVRAGRMAGMQGELGLQESMRQGKQVGLQGQFGLEEFVRQGQMAGLGGLEHLNQDQLRQLMQYDANELAMMGLTDQQVQSMLQLQGQLAQRPGWFDNVMRGLGAGAGVASSIMGLPSLNKTRVTPMANTDIYGGDN